MPSVVSAGVPSRRPLVYQGPFASNGSELRFSVMPTARSADSAWRPVSPNDDATSASTMWLSVPPVATRAPRRCSPSASARALSTMRAA